MPVLITAVALVGALGLLNLLLTFGVVRRLREHADLLRDGAGTMTPPVLRLAAGERPAPYTAVSTTGKPVSNDTAVHLVAFFSTSCSVCEERVVPFTEFVADRGISPDRVLAVVVQETDAPAAFQPQLEAVATVCAESDKGAISAAFGVSGFPAFCLLDTDGTVLAASYDPAMLPALAGV